MTEDLLHFEKKNEICKNSSGIEILQVKGMKFFLSLILKDNSDIYGHLMGINHIIKNGPQNIARNVEISHNYCYEQFLIFHVYYEAEILYAHYLIFYLFYNQ